ncbi:MAG: hypothetical protein CW716_02120 [Candidatus Bathyarchaeum sp.]|nr:MAG: hypothetical protein CW716_02120 [Candidatus Bathyarchaeum sp.]
MAIINLVNHQLKIGIREDKNTSHFEFENGVTRKTKLEQRRSPEEFQAYLRDLFDKPSPVVKYNWNLVARKKRKQQYCGVNY